MFQDEYKNFITENMCILIESIEEKINEEEFSQHKKLAIDFIEDCIGRIIDFEKSGELGGKYISTSNPPRMHSICEFFNSIFIEYTREIKNEYVKKILDQLRFSFIHYTSGGLKELYTRQENGDWTPVMIIRKILEPNDIALLPDKMTLYRGCDVSEFENKSFRQSWTFCPKVAHHFAYEQYCSEYCSRNRKTGQDYEKASQDYKKTRTIITTDFPREHVFFL